MAYRRTDDDLAYGERWTEEQLTDERGRSDDRDHFRERYGGSHERVHEKVREVSVDDRFRERRAPRPWEDDDIQDRRFHDEPSRRRPSPPPELERVMYHDRERERVREHANSPPLGRPPGLLRRQSSLDTFDRRPRREEYRPAPYEPIPLPRSRGLPPPRMYAENDYEGIKIADAHRYGDDEFHGYPERVLERETVRARLRHDRSQSRTSRSTRRRSHSSSSSSSSSITGGTSITTKSEYPKKGKTKIPSHLVSIRAIVELRYPYVIEGRTIIVQKALGQKNIDELLKLSEDYKKADIELTSSRSDKSAKFEKRKSGVIFESRKEEIFTLAPPEPPTLIRAPPPPPVEYLEEMRIRDVSPARTYTSYNTIGPAAGYTPARTPVVIDAEPREFGGDALALAGQQLALVEDRRTEYDYDYDYHHQHQHHRHHSDHYSHDMGRDLVRTERLPTGELVLREEEIVRIEEPRRGVRIEKDKKGPPPRLMRAMLATLT